MTLDSAIATLSRRRWVAGGVIGITLLCSPLIAKTLHTTYSGTSSVLLINQDPLHDLIPVADLPVLVQSPDVLNPVIAKFGLHESLDDFRLHISAKASPRSNIVPISFRDHNRDLARDVTNAIADQSVIYFHTLAARQYDQLGSYLADAAHKKQDEISSLDRQLQTASQRQPLVGSADSTDKLVAQVLALQTLQGTAQASLQADQAAAGQTPERPAELEGVIRSEALAGDPAVSALRAGTAKDDAQLSIDQSQYTSKYPGLPSLKSQVSAERAALSARENAVMGKSPASQTYAQATLDHRHAQALVAGDQARLSAITAQIGQAQRMLGVLPTSGVAANNLRLKLDAARAAYAALDLREATVGGDQAQTASLASLVVIDHADTASPRIPAMVLDVLTAVLILLAAIVAAFVWDALDAGLRKPEDIENIYGTPVVGSIGSR